MCCVSVVIKETTLQAITSNFFSVPFCFLWWAEAFFLGLPSCHTFLSLHIQGSFNKYLDHDNVLCHRLIVVRQLLAKFGMATLPRPSYSPDLAPPDTKIHWFCSIKAIQAVTTKALNSILENNFQWAFDEWQTHRTKCINAGGMYFEDY